MRNSREALQNWFRRTAGWLPVGLGIKRWVLALLAGLILLGLGIDFVLVEVYQGGWLPPFWQVVTLQMLPRWVRAMVAGGLGVGLVLVALHRLNRELLSPLVPPGRTVAGMVAERKRKQRGPRVVAIGGGTGLSTLLRGLKAHTSNITVIVTVADDGGSSGRLRRSLGVLPPGDFRNCLVALADDEALLAQLFQYRFAGSEDVGGHNFGNLFITAMGAISGSFEDGVAEASRVLAVQGQVIPSTLSDVALVADVRDHATATTQRVEGESAIPGAPGRIHRVYLQPDRPPAYPRAVKALLAADLIVAGPGSLYTSVLPNLLVPDIAAAIRASRARKLYICNVATQPGETDGYTVADHLQALNDHTGGPLFSHVLVNNRQVGQLPPALDWVPASPPVAGMVMADVVDGARPWRHDPGKLAAALMQWFSLPGNGSQSTPLEL